jgi:hypothetical protein
MLVLLEKVEFVVSAPIAETVMSSKPFFERTAPLKVVLAM